MNIEVTLLRSYLLIIALFFVIKMMMGGTWPFISLCAYKAGDDSKGYAPGREY